MTDIALASYAGADFDSSTTSYVVTKPTGLAVGELMTVVVGCIAGATITAPTPSTGSWTQTKLESANANVRLVLFQRLADTADAAATNFTFTLGTAGKGSIWMGRWTHSDASTPIEASVSTTVTSVGTTGAQSVTSVTPNNWLLYAAVSRHTAGAARTMSTSDGSDVNVRSHGSATTGFDYIFGVWHSGRDLTAGSESRTITTSAGTENAISMIMAVIRPADVPVLKARVYMGGLRIPAPLVIHKARVYRGGLRIPAPQLALKARVYRGGLRMPSPLAPTGLYVCNAGNWQQVTQFTAIGGDWI